MPQGASGLKYLPFHAVFGKIYSNSRLAAPFGMGAPLWENRDPPLVSVVVYRHKMSVGFCTTEGHCINRV